MVTDDPKKYSIRSRQVTELCGEVKKALPFICGVGLFLCGIFARLQRKADFQFNVGAILVVALKAGHESRPYR